MHWDGYTIFSVISGVCLIAGSAAPRIKVKDRLWAVIGGAGFAIYGFYVAGQTSGTFYFPIWIFIIPFVFAGYILLHAFAGRQNTRSVSRTDDSQQ